MGFSDKEHVTNYAAKGVFPKIHDAIMQMVLEHMDGRNVVDLCCHFGLLGERIRKNVKGANVIGVDADMAALELGRSGNIGIALFHIPVGPTTLDQFAELLTKHNVDTIVCRRGFSEVFVTNRRAPAVDTAFAGVFRERMKAIGVKEILLQGREPRGNSSWPIPDVHGECACLVPTYRVIEKRGECAYLKI